MNRWAKHLLLSAALLLAALSSVSAWPLLRSVDEDALAMPPAVQSVTLSAITESAGTQEQTSAEQEPEAVTSAATSLPSTAPASTEQQEQPKTLSPEKAEALRLLAEDPDTLRATDYRVIKFMDKVIKENPELLAKFEAEYPDTLDERQEARDTINGAQATAIAANISL